MEASMGLGWLELPAALAPALAPGRVPEPLSEKALGKAAYMQHQSFAVFQASYCLQMDYAMVEFESDVEECPSLVPRISSSLRLSPSSFSSNRNNYSMTL
jgi:hypothetical protein